MPESFEEKVNRVLRDHEGFTGDGRGGVGDLPVGDRSTARKPIDKRGLRELFLAPIGYAALAEAAADRAALYDGFWIDSIPDLRVDTSLSYSGDGAVSVGGFVVTRDMGAVFRVLSSSATRPHLVTAGGVKLEVAYWPRDDRGALAEIGLRAQNGQAVYLAGYGDSTVVGTDSTETYNNWPNRLGSILRAMTGNESVTVYNCGDNGKRVSDWWAWDNLAAKITTPYPNTQYVLTCWGTNDIKYDGLPDWNPALFKSRYAAHINQIRLAGMVPIMVTPWPVSAAPMRPLATYQGELLNAVRELADELMVDLIDTNAMLKNWQRDRTDQYRVGDQQSDGVHYTDVPHILIAGYMARLIYQHRVIDVRHGSRLGPQDAKFSADVTVAYNRNMSNAWGFSAQLTAAAAVPMAAEIWVWSDRARKAVYVSPDRSVVSGGNPAFAYVGLAGTGTDAGVEIGFGNAGVTTTERPAENHIYVNELPFGLSRLRFRASGAGTVEFGGWLIVDQFDPVSVSAYSIASERQLFLPEFADSRPEVVPKAGAITNLALIGNIPVGWGVVIGTQYVYANDSNTGPSRRKMSIVALRTSSGADILRVLSGASAGVFAATSIKTSGSGSWAGQITIHCTTDGSGNADIQVRADGDIIARHTNGGTDPFMSPYGRMGGLYRDNTLVSDPGGRQAVATLIPMPT